MHNNTSNRRFNPQKSTTPSTPHGLRVLPTPPGSVVRVEESSANPRPATVQSGVAPRLPLAQFSKQAKNQANGANSPARTSKTQNISRGDTPRAHRPFGQPNGLLPPLSRHSSPPPLSGLAHLVQQHQAPGSRFSSPVSSPAPEVQVTSITAAALVNSGSPKTHTSASTLFKPSRIVVSNIAEDDEEEVSYQLTAPSRQESARARSVTTDFQDDYHGPGLGSPSPTSFSKRHTEDHDTRGAPKRMRPSHNQVATFISFNAFVLMSHTLLGIRTRPVYSTDPT